MLYNITIKGRLKNMEEKTLKLLTLQDDKKGIRDIALKVVKENPIEFYPDYRDFEDIEKFVSECKDQFDFEDKIMECYDQCVYGDIQALTSPIIDELHKHYDFDEVSDSLYEYLVELIQENIIINYPFKDFLSQEVKVDLLFTFGNSTDAEEDELDYKTLSKLLLKLGYVQPKTILKEMVNGEYVRGDDKFLNSLYTEIINAYKEQFNYLTFIGTMSVEDYFNLKNDARRYTVVLNQQNYCGFFDPYNGGGSVFGIDLQKTLTIRGDTIHKIMLEGGSEKYTCDQVYGFSSDCFQPIKVVKGNYKGE